VALMPPETLTFDPADGMNAALVAPPAGSVDAALGSVDYATGVVLDDPSAAVDLAFPIGGLLVSGFREGKLLLQNDTDVMRAAKNVSIDVAGVGLGAQGGALAGTAIAGPLGTIVGGIIGGVGGKLLASHAKSRPLARAKEALLTARATYDREEAQARQDLERAWKDDEAVISRAYGGRLADIRGQVASLCGAVDGDLRSAAALSPDDVAHLLREGERQIDALLTASERELKATFLAPLTHPRAYLALRRLRSDVRAWRKQARRLSASPDASLEVTAAAFDLVLALPDGGDVAVGHVKRLAMAKQAACGSLADAVARLTAAFARERAAAVKKLRTRWDALRREVSERLQAHYALVETAAGAFEVELRKAGKAQG
jgi:hypothetical protein